KEVQPRYRMRLWVTATDNNIESGPRSATSKEQFTFIIVSETELLAEIAKEEEGLHHKLEETVTKLKDGKVKLKQIARDLAASDLKPESYSPLAIRAQEIEETIGKGGDVSREILSDYERILKELDVNRVQQGMIKKVRDGIVEPLKTAGSDDFPNAEKA